MKISEEEVGAHTVLRMEGTLALGDSTRALQERCDKVFVERAGALVLDLSGLEHLDSTAIGVLVGELMRFEAEKRPFSLVNPRERVASVFRITNLDSVFHVFPTLEAAIDAADQTGQEETSDH